MVKLVVALMVFLGIIIGSSTKPRSHHAFWGEIHPGDTLVYKKHVHEMPLMLKFVDKYVEFPVHGQGNNRLITAIRANDQKTNGHGAYASLKSGGINSTSAVLHFKSQLGHGIRFILEIWVR